VGEQSGKALFDTYEMAGVAIPGASLLLGLWWLFPTSIHGVNWKDVSLGGFGIFAVAAFCAGHVIQAPANIVMDLLWSWRGRPTERMRKLGGGLSDPQVTLIPKHVEKLLNLGAAIENRDEQWRGVVGQLAALVANAGRSARLDKFNSTFGLFRGLTVSFVLLTTVGFEQHRWLFSAITGVIAGATAFRMHRFSRYYARELWVQVLALDPIMRCESNPAK
jgi:hypothetical protein